MSDLPANNQTSWGKIALDHARTITNQCRLAPHIPGRGSATQAEAHAGRYVNEQLSSLGIEEVSEQSFSGLRSIWLFVALAFGFALSGHIAFWLLRPPLGDLPAWGVSCLAFAFASYLMWRKFTFRDYPLRTSLFHGTSQNVIAIVQPEESPRGEQNLHQVVFVSHLDSHRAVWWFTTDFLVGLYALLSPIAIYGLVLAPLAYGLAALSGLASLGWVGLAFALLHFITWFTGMTADTGPFSPGANDNASAVGVALSLASRLKNQPLQNTRVWFAFTGCEETGCDGMMAFLEQYGSQLQGALFVDFELVGIGERLVYLQKEGLIRPKRIPVRVEQLVSRVGAGFDLQPFSAAGFGAFTETGVVWERGYEGITFLALRQNSSLLPEWHRLSDTAERLQPATLGKVHELAWSLLQEIDR